MNGRYVSALSPVERARLDYLEAQAARRLRLRGASSCPPGDPERVAGLRRRWVALVEDDARHEREMLADWACHRPVGVRRGRDTAAVALAGLAGVAGVGLGVLARLLS
jgi:hypothetical protein